MLFDKDLSNSEICSSSDMVEGCICRICVSASVDEIVQMLAFANVYLSQIATSRIRQLLKDAVPVPVQDHPESQD